MGHKRCSSSFRGVVAYSVGTAFAADAHQDTPSERALLSIDDLKAYFNPMKLPTQGRKQPRTPRIGSLRCQVPWYVKTDPLPAPRRQQSSGQPSPPIPPCAHQEPSLLCVLGKSTVRRPHKTNTIYGDIIFFFLIFFFIFFFSAPSVDTFVPLSNR